jgi:alpha-tubulin suppressor-like RCC1 family protein
MLARFAAAALFCSVACTRTGLLSVGEQSSCAVLAGGSVECWGANDFGQLGVGPPDNTVHPPAPVAGITNAVSVGIGRYFACALTSAGEVQCWGDNRSGWLGDGTTEAHYAPRAVIGIPGKPLLLRVGRNHACAIDDSGRVSCWGRNDAGQLGDGTTSDRPSAAPVKGVFVELSTGDQHTCAIDRNGAVWCWGDNSYGKLGDGTNSTRLVPTRSKIAGATVVSAGLSHTCALVAGGAVQCWGSNRTGEAGPNPVDCGQTPPCAAVPKLPRAVTVSAGNNFTCAATSASEAYCWGRNDIFQLGGARLRSDGPSISTPAAVPVLLGSFDASGISCGAATTCVTTSAGAVRCWGTNMSGEGGDPSSTRISAADAHAVALNGLAMVPR